VTIQTDDFRIGRAITKEEWAELRRTSLYGLPEGLRDKDLTEILLDYQKQALKLRLLNTVSWIEKSRRIGLTWSFGADAVLVSAAEASAGGMDTWYIGYNLEMAREFIDVCGMWARLFAKTAIESGEYIFNDYDPVTGETREIKAFRIAFASGFEIVALPSSPRSLRGKQGYVLIDEAAFHDDLEELLKAAIALTIWGGMVVVISTHDGDANPFNQYCKDIRSGLKSYGHLRIDFDEALQDGLYRRICLRTGKPWSVESEAEWRQGVIDDYGDGADEELFCIPAQGSGSWILPAVIEACASRTIPVARWDMPDDFAAKPAAERESACNAWLEAVLAPHLSRLDPALPSFYGMDFGRITDISCLWPLQLERNLTRKTPFVIEMRNIPFKQQEQVLFWLVDHLPRFWAGAMDAGGNGAALAEAAAQQYGFERIAQIKFSLDWYRNEMPPFKATLEAQGMELPADVDIHADFRLVKLIDGIARIPAQRTTAKGEAAATGKKKKRHGDSAIAAALAHFASRMPVTEIEYHPVSELDNRGSKLFDTGSGGRSIW